MKRLLITLEGKTYEVGVEVIEDTGHHGAAGHQQQHHSPAQPAAAVTTDVGGTGGHTAVTSPMAGQIFKCPVRPGDRVTKNQVVLVLEAMKMETPVCAPVAGLIGSLLVREGDAVTEGQLLLQIEAA